jgi:hypothetical protein
LLLLLLLGYDERPVFHAELSPQPVDSFRLVTEVKVQEMTEMTAMVNVSAISIFGGSLAFHKSASSVLGMKITF